MVFVCCLACTPFGCQNDVLCSEPAAELSTCFVTVVGRLPSRGCTPSATFSVVQKAVSNLEAALVHHRSCSAAVLSCVVKSEQEENMWCRGTTEQTPLSTAPCYKTLYVHVCEQLCYSQTFADAACSTGVVDRLTALFFVTITRALLKTPGKIIMIVLSCHSNDCKCF